MTSTSRFRLRPAIVAAIAGRWSLVAGQVLLLICVAAYLAYFAAHVWLVLRHPYPLDYGEGPLLAQVELLRAGMPIWELYGDPAEPPYTVVNYPPLYPLLATALSWLTGDALLAGRLLSLLAALGCVAALICLIPCASSRFVSSQFVSSRFVSSQFFIPWFFLAIPIVREWAATMRVDLLGVCLGLWGLVALRRALGDPAMAQVEAPTTKRRPVWAVVAGLLFLLTLYTKPSLIAAPAAGLAWLVLRALPISRIPHPASRIPLLLSLATLGIGGALLFGLLQWSSDGWFALHVVTANANRWDFALARQFWTDVARLHWPLVLAALASTLFLSIPSSALSPQPSALSPQPSALSPQPSVLPLLPMLYTLAGVVTALGVGKVGAYTNYFLELYAGLVWLVGSGYWTLANRQMNTQLPASRQFSGWLSIAGRWGLIGLLLAALAYYPPTWSPTTLRRAGLLEPSPLRMAFGHYNLWHDTQREAEVLAALARVNRALITAVRAAGPVIFTDIPGVAAQADRGSRYQAFEQRQLLDQGYLNQQQLLLELANGALPLAVIDFLGNWLTPEMIELLQRRYAQDGSLGTFDLYRPVEPGPRIPIDLTFGEALHLSGYHLAAPAGRRGQQFAAGELLVLTLDWQSSEDREALEDVTVLVQLMDRAGRVVATAERPLLYGVFPPAAWPADTVVQHMHPLQLPTDLPPGRYDLVLTLRTAAAEKTSSRRLTRIVVQSDQGRFFTETDYFVPAAILRTWEALGGIERAGYPLTPAVPFALGTLQCFERVCLEWRAGAVTQRPLGAQHYLAETIRRTGCGEWQPVNNDWELTAIVAPNPDPAAPTNEICPAFAATWADYGGMTTMGSALSGELFRNAHVVQWTRYARLERLPESNQVNLGRLGDDALRLSPGMRYRWP